MFGLGEDAMKNLLFAGLLTIAFAGGWKLGVVTGQPEETAVKHLLSLIGSMAGGSW